MYESIPFCWADSCDLWDDDIAKHFWEGERYILEDKNIKLFLILWQKSFVQVALPLSALIFCLLLSFYRDFEKVRFCEGFFWLLFLY